MSESLLTRLPDADDTVEPDGGVDADHPMRAVVSEVAFEGGWSPGRAAKIGELFDSMADQWTETHSSEIRVAPVVDAVARGDLGTGRWLELGAGTGIGTRILEAVVSSVVGLDLAQAMLANTVAASPRVQADAAHLPFGDGRFDGVSMVNMLLFPDEVDRVLNDVGRILWVNTMGDRTPIHLPPDQVLAALPGTWSGTWARSGEGFWLVGERHRP